MKFLLRLKSWQLFLLLLIPCFAPGGYLIGKILNSFWVIMYVGWVYEIGVAMHSLIPPKLQPKAVYFKLACLYVIIAFISLAFFSNFFLSVSPDKNSQLFVLFLALMLTVIGASFYIFSFAARMLESVINKRIVGFNESLKAFFCIWIFPYGIWHVQPVLQVILKKKR
jgi:hypothetical protein